MQNYTILLLTICNFVEWEFRIRFKPLPTPQNRHILSHFDPGQYCECLEEFKVRRNDVFRSIQSVSLLADNFLSLKLFLFLFFVSFYQCRGRKTQMVKYKQIQSVVITNCFTSTLAAVVTAASVLKDNLITGFLTFFNSNFKLNYPSSTGSGKSCFLLLVEFGGLEEMARNSTFQRIILCEQTFVREIGYYFYQQRAAV